MISPRFERNLGFLSTEEQERLHGSSVAIAGVGGDGGMLAIQLARMGVGSMRFADPDPFEIENINRQATCRDSTLGVNKAEAVAEYAQDINPELKIEVFKEGITSENAGLFVAGQDLLVDETEYTMQHLAVMLAREARKEGIPNMTALNIAFAAVVTTYSADGPSLEKRLGFEDDTPIEEIMATEADLSRWLPYLPKYGDIEVLQKIATGEKSAPSIAPGVAMAAALGATQAFVNLTADVGNKRPKPVTAPKALVVDAITGKSNIIRYNRVSHFRHLGHMVARNVLKLNPSTSY
ncbi:MAG: ThiF family adenylyltransferase [Patescibacteria group bacterium]|jgi:molybdopterin/thiamine biosynthesis adenylyltransferase|nr:ThiF family adenylyltransferase [Patescibacteria group bacterium]